MATVHRYLDRNSARHLLGVLVTYEPVFAPSNRGEHGIVSEKLEHKLFEQRRRLCLQCFEDLVPP